MSALRAVLLGAAGLVAAVVAAVVLLRGGSGDDAPPVLRGQLIATSTSVVPRSSLFGDRVRAELEVLFDSARVRPGSVKAQPSFSPYRIVERTEQRERVGGGATRIRYRFLLECLTRECLPQKSGHVQFPRTRVDYVVRALGNRPQLASVDWPALRVASRIGFSDLNGLKLQADVRQLPAVSYRVRPRALALAGWALAALLVLVGMSLLARALDLKARIASLRQRRRRRLSPLQRALALVRRTTERGERDESRRALERLAGELRGTREPELARRASRLAWSRRDPSGQAVDPLSIDVERVISEETR